MSIKLRVAQSFQTIKEMLHDRGLTGEKEQRVLEGFSDRELGILSSKNIFNIDVGTNVRIVYMLGKFKIADLKPFISEDVQYELYIFVMLEKLTTNNLKSISEVEKKSEAPLNVQYFVLNELVFNITKHVLVPKHELIPDDEIDEVIKRYNLKTKHQLPIILKTDPVARYYGLKSGNVVKITRVSPSAGEYIIYRCCV